MVKKSILNNLKLAMSEDNLKIILEDKEITKRATEISQAYNTLLGNDEGNIKQKILFTFLFRLHNLDNIFVYWNFSWCYFNSNKYCLGSYFK